MTPSATAAQIRQKIGNTALRKFVMNAQATETFGGNVYVLTKLRSES